MSAVCATPRQPLLIACAELPSTLSAARVPFEVPERDELADRLASVLEVIYLIFNVCHGGYGSTLGALAHGVPLVVVPLFSIDQWANADAVARVGAGVALTGERRTRRVLDLPGPATLAELAPAVSRVLADSAYRSAAALVADAVSALLPVDAAVDLLAAVSRGDAPPPGGQSASAA